MRDFSREKNITEFYKILGAIGTQTCTVGSGTLYKTGCLTKFGAYISEHAISLGAVGIALAFFQVTDM